MEELERTISFPNIFNLTNGKTNTSSNNVSIQECLYLLINSMHLELLGDPLYGSNILANAYDYNGAILRELIVTKLVESVRLYEPRIELTPENVEVVSDDTSVIITLKYLIKNLGTYDVISVILNIEDKENE